jgi:hypothetical protein
LLEGSKLPGTGPDEPTRHGRRTDAEHCRDQLGGVPVLMAGQTMLAPSAPTRHHDPLAFADAGRLPEAPPGAYGYYARGEPSPALFGHSNRPNRFGDPNGRRPASRVVDCTVYPPTGLLRLAGRPQLPAILWESELE